MPVEVDLAVAGDLPELSDVAAETFPLACPPSVSQDDVASFIAEHLSLRRFTEYLADANRVVLVARSDDRILGYAMLIRGVPDDPSVDFAVPLRPATELSKMYVVPEHHGADVAGALMNAALGSILAVEAAMVWLGVNQKNERAQRFYAKHGFTVNGDKTFRLGQHVERDYVMVRESAPEVAT